MRFAGLRVIRRANFGSRNLTEVKDVQLETDFRTIDDGNVSKMQILWYYFTVVSPLKGEVEKHGTKVRVKRELHTH